MCGPGALLVWTFRLLVELVGPRLVLTPRVTATTPAAGQTTPAPSWFPPVDVRSSPACELVTNT